MVEPIDGRELLAVRARAARAGYGLHQSLAVTEADRDALLREVYRLRAELELHVGCRVDVSIGDALRLIRGEESNAPAPTPATAATEAHGETTEAPAPRERREILRDLTQQAVEGGFYDRPGEAQGGPKVNDKAMVTENHRDTQGNAGMTELHGTPGESGEADSR